MDGYLTTCGDWQRDATYRFTADNWDVPQYVYVYAHNDKDSHDLYNSAFEESAHPDYQGGSAHVRHGGNENVDASVGFDPVPHTDGDGRSETDTGATEATHPGNTDGTHAYVRPPQVVNADAMVNGRYYTIKTVGDSDWTTSGAADSAVGTAFLATGPCGDQGSCGGSAGSAGGTATAMNTRPSYNTITEVPPTQAYTTTIRHYVETEDTLDNMQRAGFVQWNKFGGTYTAGNIERFPFGFNRYNGRPGYAKLDEAGDRKSVV